MDEKVREEAKEYVYDILLSLLENYNVWLYPADFARAANIILYNVDDIHLDEISLCKMILLLEYVAPERPLAPAVRNFIGAVLFDLNYKVLPKCFQQFLPEFLAAVYAHTHDVNAVEEARVLNEYYQQTGTLPEQEKATLENIKLHEKILEVLEKAEKPLFIAFPKVFDLTPSDAEELAKEIDKEWPVIKAEFLEEEIQNLQQ